MIQDCRVIQESTRLTVSFDGTNHKPNLTFQLKNDSTSSLWIPIEPNPSFRMDETHKTVTVFLGYFENIYGQFRGQYMLPAMQELKPGVGRVWSIVDGPLMDKPHKNGYRPYVKLRAAFRNFPQSRTRGEQDLDAYLRESCTLESTDSLPL